MWTSPRKEQPSPAAAPRPRAARKGGQAGRKWGAPGAGGPAEGAKRRPIGRVSIALMPTPQRPHPPCASSATTLALNQLPASANPSSLTELSPALCHQLLIPEMQRGSCLAASLMGEVEADRQLG
jgi:hypothetical protein